jgi:hypothetical protein
LPKEKHTLYWNSAKGKQRWIESMWDPAAKKQSQLIARAWGAKTPRMPTLALHLKSKSGSQVDPQKIYVVPEPGFATTLSKSRSHSARPTSATIGRLR